MRWQVKDCYMVFAALWT